MTQLYRVRSRRSWGVGDLADLADLAVWAARELGAGLRAGQPAARGRAGAADGALAVPADHRGGSSTRSTCGSRTSPSSATCRPPSAQLLEWHADGAARASTTDDVIDRDAVVDGQAAALRDRLRSCPARRGASARSRRSASARARGCVDFATWCALAEEHGLPTGATWPERAAATRARPAVAAFARRTWPTGSTSTAGCSGCSTSSSAAQQAGAGRPAWRSASCTTSPSACTPTAPTPGRCRTCCARGVTVGAPPDAFNQGPGLDPAAVAAGPAGRSRLRAVPRHAAHRAAARRRHAGRPHHRAVPAVVGPGGRDARPRAPTCATTTRR